MKEDKIEKRIKELQNDRRYMFKLTEDVIALTYRTAIEDCAKEKKDPDKVYKKDDGYVSSSSKEMNKKFGSKHNEDETPWEKKEKEAKVRSEIYSEILHYIENHSDLMDVYVYVKDKAREYYDIKMPNRRGCP